MTRSANPKSVDGFNVKARNVFEQDSIGKLKWLANQDQVEISDLVFEALGLLFRVHHECIGFNPNRQLTSFTQPLSAVVKCSCGKTAVKHGKHLQTGKEKDFCLECFGKVPLRHDPKVWRFN